jgi:segregation and condensation protein B
MTVSEMEASNLKNIVEAALLAAGRPIDVEQIRNLFEEYQRPPAVDVRQALELLASDYEGRALQLIEVSSGWRLQVRREFSETVSRLWQERPARYSRALLETLALIAYRQPITRAEIEDVRGVAVNPNIIRTLSERGWIRVVGHREVPGRPELLGTTRDFLDYFGLKSLDQLPTLAELRDMDNVGVQLEFGETGSQRGEDPEADASEAARPPGTSEGMELEAANDPDATTA